MNTALPFVWLLSEASNCKKDVAWLPKFPPTSKKQRAGPASMQTATPACLGFCSASWLQPSQPRESAKPMSFAFLFHFASLGFGLWLVIHVSLACPATFCWLQQHLLFVFHFASLCLLGVWLVIHVWLARLLPGVWPFAPTDLNVPTQESNQMHTCLPAFGFGVVWLLLHTLQE